MDRAVLHQRIKYLIEEGGLHPEEKPASRHLFLKITATILLLQVCDLAAHFLEFITR